AKESEIGVKIGGRNINNLCYADDTTLLVETEDGLKDLILRIKKESEKMSLHLNIKKMKILTTAGNGAVKITINSEEIECVKVFCFLCRSAMLSIHQIWKSKDISLTTKCKMVHDIVFPISMYGCESWTLKKADRKRLDAFELRCWRRLLRIPWTPRVTNKEVLERIKPEISLEGKITRLRLTYFGHVMRSDSLEKPMMLGMVSGTRRRDLQRTRWLDAIKMDTGLSKEQLKEKVLDRKVWREMTYRIAESRIRLTE
uniref:Reverse transcriptase domain-containing protein n=1 Tax=Lepisosteus oculatus TaxID=7918 RepID=W5NIE2_LEPOC